MTCVRMQRGIGRPSLTTRTSRCRTARHWRWPRHASVKVGVTRLYLAAAARRRPASSDRRKCRSRRADRRRSASSAHDDASRTDSSASASVVRAGVKVSVATVRWSSFYSLKLAFHGADTDTDTDFLARILAGGNRTYRTLGCIDVSGESVSAPWNASFTGPALFMSLISNHFTSSD